MERTRARRRKWSAIDVFSGCGGLSLGLRQAGFDVIAAIENNEKACNTYRLNHRGTRLYEADVRSIDSTELMHDLKTSVFELDLLAGCPPCQGFSRITRRNKRRPAKDDRNYLIDEFSRLALELKPKIVLLENVPHLTTYHRFKRFRSSLVKLGYQTRFRVLDAADYGVPQRRKRLIFVAARSASLELEEPKYQKRTVSDALRMLPRPEETTDPLHNSIGQRSDRVHALIRSIPHDGGSRSSLTNEQTLACHKSSDGFHDVYGRMSWNCQAPTITSGCVNPSKGRFLHPEQDRAISLREASLLQGFPPDYLFDISAGREALALMIGNAIPPPVAASHASMLAKQVLRETCHADPA